MRESKVNRVNNGPAKSAPASETPRTTASVRCRRCGGRGTVTNYAAYDPQQAAYPQIPCGCEAAS